MEGRGRRSAGAQKPTANGFVNWDDVAKGSDDESDGAVVGFRRRKQQQAEDSDVDMNGNTDEDSENEDDGDSDANSDQNEGPAGRRSSRLKGNRKSYTLETDLDLITRSPPRLRGRTSTRPTRGRGGRRTNGRRARSLSSSPEPAQGTRRSGRTRAKPVGSMRERQEDEISEHSGNDAGMKVVGTKEVFRRVDEHDDFRKRHREECDTCDRRGDDPSKGPLVFCQGCTTAYHKTCLGYRGTRDHMVTKIGEENFVLQCRRCIGIAHDKDPLAPHLGQCETCKEMGINSTPFRTRLSVKQEQAQREENGGKDPITIVEDHHINKPENVLFRCFSCQRGWHVHHLPNRQTVTSTAEDEEEDKELSDEERAEKRWQLYHRGWRCKDCIENKYAIDALVAWRPVNIDTYIPGYHADMVQDSQKEYLVKWKNKSYLRCNWMPGSWVWGTAAGNMRMSFMKKPENYIPRMTTKDAIPEEFFRIDIVFAVRYTSVVRNTSKEVDFARVREVESAFVKYKGLGYEDAIWESPPSFRDTERWNDFNSAYNDYVLKLHTSIPIRTTLNRTLTALRQLDFEKSLMRKEQPSSITGGSMMQYQLEGLNWLYFQWFQNQNAILADEMGLGKTIQLVAFFALLVQEHKCWPFLVVVPNSTVPNWRREIKTWVPSLRVVTYYGSSQARKITHDYELFPEEFTKKKSRSGDPQDIKAHVVIASYESIIEDKTRNSLKNVPWQGLVVDEGQRLKNDKNQVYDILTKTFRFPFKVLLTGTPLQNNVRELFNLLQFLDRTINAAEMEAKYATLTQDNVPELHEKLRKFFLRRTKAQVLTFLPPMAQIIIPVSMSGLQKKLYKSILAKNPQLMKSIFTRDPTAATKERVSLNNILMQLRKTLCHPFVYSREIEERNVDSGEAQVRLIDASPKLQLLSLMLPKLKDRGHRVLIFSQFLDNLDIIEDFLDGLGLMHRRLDGNTASLEKQKRIDEYNAPDSPYFAFLLSTRAGGVGINLATADTVIILDPDFNPHQDIQALSRAHRIGQKNKVLVFQLMTKDSAEEKIMQIGKKKMALDHVLIENMNQDDEAGMDLESILRHGAEALFDEDSKADDIVYDAPSIDKLLDRSQVEDTKINDEQSAESQFSFARVWANKTGAFEEAPLSEDTNGTNTPNPGIWDKILKERERAYEEEMALKAQTFGRGKRRRQIVDYGQDGVDGGSPDKRKKGDVASDGDFTGKDTEQDEDDGTEDDSEVDSKRPTVKGQSSPPILSPYFPQAPSPPILSPYFPQADLLTARPFKRVKVPTGQPPYNLDGTNDYMPRDGIMPPSHHCTACDERHAMGWCRLKVAGVEHCGLCGIAHLGHSRTCPHLTDEKQLVRLLETLKESPESREDVEAATKYLRMIRGDLVSRARRKREEEQVARSLATVSTNLGTISTGLGGGHQQGMANGYQHGGTPEGRWGSRFVEGGR
jgi:chromodomain-helicase-DNA-binding protein 4